MSQGVVCTKFEFHLVKTVVWWKNPIWCEERKKLDDSVERTSLEYDCQGLSILFWNVNTRQDQGIIQLNHKVYEKKLILE